MKKVDNEAVEYKPGVRILLRILLVFAFITSIFLIFNLFKLRVIDSYKKLFNILILLLIFIDIVFFFKVRGRLSKKKKKIKSNKLLITFMIIYIFITLIVGGVIYYVYSFIGGFNKNQVTYSSSLVVMSKSSYNDIEDVKDTVIGMIKDKTSPDGYIIPQLMIRENKLHDNNKIKKYDNYSSMMADLYSGNIDAIFISTDYKSMFNGIDDYNNIGEDTKILITKEKKMLKTNVSKKDSQSIGKNIKNPFTILLMGVDSEREGLSKNTVANGDSLILITFNPKTLNATMISIPRDSYVPIACWSNKAENKITHAAAYGTDCMMQTIENYFDIDIDYYAKINFKGLVKLVDAMGGIDVEVPKDLCTDNSDRTDEVCIKEGLQHLNGEEALVLSRNRKQLANGDLGRGQNQQLVIQAMVNKIKTVRSAKAFLNILNTISNNLDTNFTQEQILSFYNIAEDLMNSGLSKSDSNLVDIQQLYLQGTGQMIYDENARMVLWDYIPNPSSRDDVIKAMKTNLGLINYDVSKEFSFSINEEYEKEIIGMGPYKTAFSYDLVPDFTGLSEAAARSLATRNGVKVSFTGGNGYVISQSAPVSKRVDKLSGGSVTLTLSKISSESTDKKETTKNNDKITTDKSTDKSTDKINDKDSTKDDDDKNSKPADEDDSDKIESEKKDSSSD